MRLSCFLLLILALATRANAAGLPPDAADLVATLLPEVVSIEVVQLIPPANPAERKNQAAFQAKYFQGSGFIVDPAGLIVTNKHVIENASRITITFTNRERRRATLVYTAPIDMAVLKVEAGHPLKPVTFGNSALMRPGDPVLAIGNPLGIGTTVTSGIVSALDRDIQETPVDAFIQTDAAINHGNSGGPLFNIKGQVIGMDTALFSAGSGTGSVGLGFAIPGNDVKFVLDQVARYGRVRLGWFGASAQTLTSSMADAVGLPEPPHGVILADILPNAPAAKAGFQPGDVVLKIGDSDVNETRDFNRAVAATPFNSRADVVYWRDHASHTQSVLFGESPSSQPEVMAMRHVTPMMMELTPQDLGFAQAQITPALAKKFKLPPTQRGLVITRVDNNSIAQEEGLQTGDVVVRVGNTPISDIAAVRAQVDAARQAHDHHVLIMVWRDGGVRWLAMPLFREADAPLK